MDKQNDSSLEMRRSVTTIVAAALSDEIVEEIATIMQRHGGSLEVTPTAAIYHFPPNTYKTLVIPEMQRSRYIIHVPDGALIDECELPSGQPSIIFELQEFSPEFQAKYKREQNKQEKRKQP